MASTRIRLIAGTASIALAAALLAVAYADARVDRLGIGAVSLAAVITLAYGLVRRSDPFIGVALASTAAAYLVQLHADHETLPLTTAVYAGALLAVAELAHRSAADGSVAVPALSIRRWTVGVVGVASAAGIGAAALVTILRAFHGRTPWLEPLGFLAILAATLLFRREKPTS